MHPFLVIQGGSVANFADENGQAIVPPWEQADTFLRAAVAAFWSSVSATPSSCPYQQPLEASVRSLEYNVYNLGFVRAEAALGVLALTLGDDCSLNDPFSFFIDFNATPPTLKPVSPFDCFALGVTCAESLTDPGLKSNCRDLEVDTPEEPPLNEGEVDDSCSYGGIMLPAKCYADRLRALKPDRPALLLSIAGPQDPVEVVLEESQLQLKPVSCDPLMTLPGIRLESYAHTTAINWYQPVCDGDLVGLGQMATNEYLNQAVRRCFPDVLVDQDPNPGIQADCDVEFVNAPGTAQEEIVATLEPCSTYSGSYSYCWELEGPLLDSTCPTGITLNIVNMWGGFDEYSMGEVVRAVCTMEKR